MTRGRRRAPGPLDGASRRARLDPSGMGAQIEGWPEQLRAAASIAEASLREIPAGTPRRLILLGMGGSAIAGELLRSLVEREGTCPVEVVRHFEPPPGIGAEDFLVFSSYSGETEETLQAYAALRGVGARACAIGTGGRLLARARSDGLPCALLPSGMPPRAALGYSFGVLALLAGRVGLLRDAAPRVESASAVLQGLASAWGPSVVTSRNRAKQLAIRLRGRPILVLGDERTLFAAALRWKGQMNENAKQLAWASALPEMTHNEVDGFVTPAGVVRRLAVVLLRERGDHDSIVRRFDWLRAHLKRRGARVETVAEEGDDSMTRLLATVLLGDFVSYYLALLNGTDPSALPGVEGMKRALSA